MAADLLEIELKLELAPADIEQLEASQLLARYEATTDDLIAGYFDTADAALYQAGYSLRVRRIGARRIQTVKVDAGGAGLFVREELEQEVGGDEPELSAGLRQRLFPAGRDAPLLQLFSTRIERTARRIPVAGGEVELVLDRGEILAGKRRVSVSELEIELKGSEPAALFALARELDEVVPLRLGVLTKSERGYRLLSSRAGRAAKAEPVLLVRGMTSAAAFQAIAQSCIRQFRLNEGMLTGPGRGASLHQARVGLRRLRSALSLFKPMLGDDPRFEHIRGELRWLSSVLGAARNLDVLIERGQDPAVMRRLRRARTKSYGEVTLALGSSRVRRLMLDLAEWLALGGWIEAGNPDALSAQPIERTARTILTRHARRLKRRSAGLTKLSDHDRHEVRIEAKKLRYAVEFFASLFRRKKPARRHAAFLARLEDLQVQLGDLNDQATAPLVLQDLGFGPETIEDITARDRQDRDALLAKAADARRALIDSKPFWRKP